MPVTNDPESTVDHVRALRDGSFLVNAGEDVHAVGSLAPLASLVACIVIRPHGSRNVARVQPDPLVQQPTDRDRRF
jgi:hypothetical protein